MIFGITSMTCALTPAETVLLSVCSCACDAVTSTFAVADPTRRVAATLAVAAGSKWTPSSAKVSKPALVTATE